MEDMHIAVLAAKIAPYEGLFPIDCAYHFKLNGTLLDSSNTAFMQKLVEDGLVQAGIIPDDSRKYVRWVAKLSDKCAKGEYDSVEVTFSPACGQT